MTKVYSKKDEILGEKETNCKIVIHRKHDNISFIEIDQTDIGIKRDKFNYVLVRMNDHDLRELRDVLIEAMEEK